MNYFDETSLNERIKYFYILYSLFIYLLIFFLFMPVTKEMSYGLLEIILRSIYGKIKICNPLFCASIRFLINLKLSYSFIIIIYCPHMKKLINDRICYHHTHKSHKNVK